MEKEFVPYAESLKLKEIGFNEPCLAYYDKDGDFLGDISVNEDTDNLYTNADFVMYQDFKVADVSAPTFSQAINFLYICSNKQIDIELKASDTYEERLRKIDQGCEDLWNLQNSKSN